MSADPTQQVSLSKSPQGALGGRLRASGIAVATAAVAVLAGLAGPGLLPAAGAATPAVSQARGQFLAGTIAGNSLDSVAAISPENAANFGGPTVTSANSLDVSALSNAIKLPLTNVLQLPGGNVITLGAVNQYAQAVPDGSAHAASGAVNNSGGIGIGGQNGTPPANASIDLAGLGGSSVASMFGDLLSLGAISAKADQAAGSRGAQTGRYQIAGLTLDLSSPAMKTAIGPAITSITSTLQSLATAFNGAGLGVVTVTGVDKFPNVAKALTSVSTPSGSVTADLTTGSLHIDVAKLLADGGLDLNNLPKNTHLMPYLSSALATGMPKALTALLNSLQSKLSTAFNGLGFTVGGNPVNLSTNNPLSPILNQMEKSVGDSLSSGAQQLSGVFTPLASQFSSQFDAVINGQSSVGGTFTERAVELLLGAGSGADLVLASASVGPSSVATVNPPAQPAAGSSAQPAGGVVKIDAGRPSSGSQPAPIVGLVGLGLLLTSGVGTIVTRRLRTR
ncbi:MAG TPA: choice-of-anchor G family protein [Jatrophihabitans sp.]|jgi:hypothetical protein